MQSAGVFVSALPEFSTGVQVREHQLDRRHFPFRMNVDWNAAPVVFDRDTAVDMHGHLDLFAESREMFVDRIVDDFINQVMQAAFVRVADVHTRPLPDRFQAFELVDLRRVVFLRFIDAGRGAFWIGIFVVGIRCDGGSGWHRKKLTRIT